MVQIQVYWYNGSIQPPGPVLVLIDKYKSSKLQVYFMDLFRRYIDVLWLGIGALFNWDRNFNSSSSIE